MILYKEHPYYINFTDKYSILKLKEEDNIVVYNRVFIIFRLLNGQHIYWNYEVGSDRIEKAHLNLDYIIRVSGVPEHIMTMYLLMEDNCIK